MRDIRNACERLTLSRDRLRTGLRVSAAAPVNTKTPLHIAGMVARDAVEAAVQPLAQRNPLGLVLGAAIVGGALVWSRPWRWLLTPALLATVLPQLAARAFNHGAPMPWMKLLNSLVNVATKPRAVARSRPQ
jgi:hypothetical protein